MEVTHSSETLGRISRILRHVVSQNKSHLYSLLHENLIYLSHLSFLIQRYCPFMLGMIRGARFWARDFRRLTESIPGDVIRDAVVALILFQTNFCRTMWPPFSFEWHYFLTSKWEHTYLLCIHLRRSKMRNYWKYCIGFKFGTHASLIILMPVYFVLRASENMPEGERVAGQLLKSFVPSFKKWTGFITFYNQIKSGFRT